MMASEIHPKKEEAQVKQVDITTIDLLYSFEEVQATFSENTVKKMSRNLKLMKKQNREAID